MTAKRRYPAESLSSLQKQRTAWFAAICAGLSIVLLLSVDRQKPEETPSLTPAEFGEALFDSGKYARAASTLKASYRLNPTLESRLQLMNALYASGDYAGVLEIAADDIADTRSVTLLKAESLLKLHRYEEARSVALEMLLANARDAEAAFIAARSTYALGRFEAAQGWLQKVLRMQSAIVGEAWMLRARMALDRNSFSLAQSAAARASDAGVNSSRIEAVKIETDIRAGKLKEANEALAVRNARFVSSNQASSRRLDTQALYLEALLFHARGEGNKAARAFDIIEPWLKHEIRGPAQLAAVNWRAGDIAQAETLIRQYVEKTPDDWVSLDLYAAFSIATGALEQADQIIKILNAERATLGRYRQFQTSIESDDFDDAYEVIAETQQKLDDENFETSMGFLFGLGGIEEKEISSFNKLVALAQGDTTIVELKNAAVVSTGYEKFTAADPIAFTLHGTLHLENHEPEKAVKFLDKALLAAPDFKAALTLRTLVDVYLADFDKARGRLKARLIEYEADIHTRILLARLLKVERSPGFSIALLQDYELALLAFPNAALFYADLLIEERDTTALIVFSDEARRRLPESLLTAQLVEQSNRPAEAARIYRAALIAAPTDGARAREYGRIMEGLGREQEAISLLDTLIRQNTDALGAIEELIRLQEKSGDVEGREVSMNLLAANDEKRASRLDVNQLSPPHMDSVKSTPTLEVARRAYLGAPENGAAAYQYGVALAATGEGSAAMFRIACFWGSRQGCMEASESDS